MRRTLLTTVLAATLLLAACSSEDSGVRVAGPAGPASTTSPATTGELGGTTTTPPGTTAPPATAAGGLSGREVLRRIGPSMAFIETPYGSGSGIVVDDRYVVTNFHVVEPFGTATVTIGGTDRIESVPVVGVDVKRDLALLGPVDTDATSLEPTAPTGLAAGDDLYLVGYPGEFSVTSEPTISRGILSQIREEPDWDLTYLQTDAAIAGGQSGGALVDGRGRVVGISGLSFGDANDFALALVGDEVAGAITELAAGGGDRYRAIPDEGTETSGTVELLGADGEQAAVLRNDGDDLVWRLTLDPAAQPLLWVIDDFGTPLFVSDAWLQQAADRAGTPVEEYRSQLGYDAGASREVEPGVFDIDIPAGTFAVAFVGTASATPVAMPWTSSVPLFMPPDDDEGRTVEVGGSLEGITEYVESYDTVVVELTAGEPVQITVRSPIGDPVLEVAGPGQAMEDGESNDDANTGLYGLDASLTYTPTASGPHRIRISSADGYTMYWKLTVERA